MSFKSVDNNPNFSQMEHQKLQFWREHDTFNKLVAQNAGGPHFSFIDGPITANNPMGVHHAWGRTYKDLYQRYKAMQGFAQRYQNGFDCQGLWLEVEVEKALGFNSKRDIEAYGLDNFAEQCRARVLKFSEKQTQQSIRLGQWMDWANSYYTMNDSNIEYIWHFLKVVNERGWLAEKALIMPWCIRCGTSLAQHELTDSYRTVTHRSVYVKLPLNERPDEYLLAWTTTPWTLSSNMALAVNPNLEYAKVRQGEESYYLSTGTLKLLKGDFVQEGTLKGSELIELAKGGYHGPFDDLPFQQGVVHPVLPWEEVSDAEGTGIVHIAPGCGAEDYALYTSTVSRKGLIAPIDDSGNYYPQFGRYAGRNVREVTSEIFADLTAKGVVYKIEDYTHRYPVCWRCGEDLVYRLVDEWFILADGPEDDPDPAHAIRPQMKAAANQVRWIPEASGKRMQNWLDNMGDWCISRKRYWGLPLPFYRCADGHLKVVGGRAELRELATNPEQVDTVKELHRPWIDAITIHCPTCGQEAKRVTEVGDCWLDAGIAPFSTLKYLEDKDYWQSWFPAEFITEMHEQVRLWFYSQLFMSVTLTGQPPYQTVLTNGTVRDENGERISKTKGNGVPYDQGVEKMGADVMRWMYASQNVNSDINFGYGPAREVTRKLLTLWNTYSFFVTYANLDKVEVSKLNVPLAQRSELDRWVLASLNLLIKQARASLDQYDAASVTRGVDEFVEDLSNWYVRRSRRRFWKSESDTDKLAAYATLYECLTTLSRLVAPILPFIAEELYQNLVASQDSSAPQSVHLASYPVADEGLIDAGLVEEFGLVIKVVNMGRRARQLHELKVRQPLAAITVRVRSQQEAEWLTRHVQQIEEELNVKAVKLTTAGGELVSYVIKPNLPLLGKKYGKQLPAIKAALAEADAVSVAANATKGEPVMVALADGTTVELLPSEVLVETREREGLAVVQDEGLVVALDTELTPELKAEGAARDLVRAIQDMRKAAKFNIADRIITYYVGDGAAGAVMQSHRDYIAGETLSRELVNLPTASELPAEAYQQEVELGGQKLLLALKQTGEQASGVVVEEE